MDTALHAAEVAVAAAISGAVEGLDNDGRNLSEQEKADFIAEITNSDELTRLLSPFVATIAEKLRDGDWDCIDESEYFDRFPQEMLGYDDQRYRTYLHEKLRDTDPGEYNYSGLVRNLANIQAKLEGDSGTG